MARAKPISKTVYTGRQIIIKAAAKVVDMVYQLTVFKHKDVENKPFKPYSEYYQKKKSVSDSVGGVAGAPDLSLSGKMMRSLLAYKNTATEESINVGWLNPKSVQKLIWNASDRGKNRQVSKSTGSFPFSKRIEEVFFKEIDTKLSKNVKSKKSRQVFKLGM